MFFSIFSKSLLLCWGNTESSGSPEILARLTSSLYLITKAQVKRSVTGEPPDYSIILPTVPLDDENTMSNYQRSS